MVPFIKTGLKMGLKKNSPQQLRFFPTIQYCIIVVMESWGLSKMVPFIKTKTKMELKKTFLQQSEFF